MDDQSGGEMHMIYIRVSQRGYEHMAHCKLLETWAQQLYLLIYHNLFLALLWNIQKHLLNNDNELALSVQKKSKAALLTEGHCVAALKGLLEEFVHKFVYVQHQGWVHRFAYTC